MDDKFDVIIIGGGIAGCTCALLLARAGVNVLLLERAEQAGGKNISGGRLYSYSLETILPEFAQSAPIERQITQEKLSLLTNETSVTVDYRHPEFAQDATSYSVLRARFDPWLMVQAQNAGAQCLTGVQVDALIQESGAVCGVQIGDDRLYAHAVVLAEGANSLLAEQHQLVKKPPSHTMGIGVKEVLALPQSRLEERFSLENNQGTAWLFAGETITGKAGGGFLYTNRDTLSIGLVCNLSVVSHGKNALPQMLESFKQHPLLRPLLKETELLEYGAHLIPEGGINALNPPFGAGYLIAGDTAGFCVNSGHTIRGMDLAVISAQAVADTLTIALQKDDFSAASLAAYQTHLENSTLWTVLKQYRGLPDTLLKNPRYFAEYPQITSDILRELFEINRHPAPPLRNILWKHARRAGLITLFKDLIGGARSL
ncbi:FAD-dependent oxidoreductase [Limnobaculum parvum]|uniref:Protein FixC n=1 Tax=Limnobaculum parvum TaxID=2172103 RepID=A0A2Y9TWN7_9GAMM|nr:FAD-dependent oxidoreductase [Limnobaculum parvum]AWH88158.1 FAD-dependent oxidoreductase [Limnobaculum parvum]